MADFGDSTHTVRRLFTSQKIRIKMISLVGCAKPRGGWGSASGSDGLGASS